MEPIKVRIHKDADAAKFIAQLVREGLNFTAEEFEYHGDHLGDGWITIYIYGY